MYRAAVRGRSGCAPARRAAPRPVRSLRIPQRGVVTVVTMVRGSAMLVTALHGPRRLSAGEVALVRGSDIHVVPDAAEAAAPADTAGAGVGRWSDPHGTLLVHGGYDTADAVRRRLVQALPPVAVLRHRDLGTPVLGLLADEAGTGQRVVRERLLDLAVTGALRAWFTRHDAPAWYRASGDPLVGRALQLLQHHPARPWTVAELAAAVGVSRAALARRFTALVGEPPMTFLTEWRLALAADLLRDTGHTIDAIARRVGYSTAFALSAAFKRRYGVAPREYRRTAISAESGSAGASPSARR